MCADAVPQTSGANKLRKRNFRPMVNNNKVMPKSANFSSAGPPYTPKACKAKPTPENPTKGGSLIYCAVKPSTGATNNQRGAMSHALFKVLQ